MAKALLLPCLLFLASTLRGQLPGPHGFQPEQNNSFTVTVDGAGRSTPDTIRIMAQVPALGAAITFFRSISVRPGKAYNKHFSFHAPALMQLNDSFFVAGDRDSIHIAWDAALNRFAITGGRYPANYSLYSRLSAMPDPLSRYSPRTDNYSAFISAADSNAFLKIALVKKEFEAGRLSKDALDYLSAYIKYDHLRALLRTRSPSLRRLLPFTHSTFTSTITFEDFRHDEYADMLNYSFCTLQYIRLHDHDPYAQVGYVIDSLSGNTRSNMLYYMVVQAHLHMKDGNHEAYAGLYSRIRQLPLPPDYSRAIEQQYEKTKMENEPLDPSVAAHTRLVSLTGDRLTLQDLLLRYLHQGLVMEFPAPDDTHLQVKTNLPPAPAASDSSAWTVLSVYLLKGSFAQWKKTHAGMAATLRLSSWFVENGLKSPLASYLHLQLTPQADGLPRYTVMDATGKIKWADAPLSVLLQDSRLRSVVDRW